MTQHVSLNTPLCLLGCGGSQQRASLDTRRDNTMAQPTPAQRMEHVIRTYIQACNDADAEAIAASFCPDAVHYFPSRFKWSGAATIGSNFAQRVRKQGHCWTVDQLLIDVDRCAAALEWTRFDGQQAQIV